MAYGYKSDFLEAPIPIEGDIGDPAEELAQVAAVDAATEGAIRSVTDEDINGILTGWTISDGGGLSIDVAAGKGFIQGSYCVSAAPVTVSSLPDDTSPVYVFAVRGALPNGDKTVTFQASASGAVPSGGMEIARCVTAGGSVTSVDNDSAGRPPLAGGMPRRQIFDTQEGDNVYTLDRTPRVGFPVHVYMNGQRLAQSDDTTDRDYSVSGTDITLDDSIVPPSSDPTTPFRLDVDYFS